MTALDSDANHQVGCILCPNGRFSFGICGVLIALELLSISLYCFAISFLIEISSLKIFNF